MQKGSSLLHSPTIATQRLARNKCWYSSCNQRNSNFELLLSKRIGKTLHNGTHARRMCHCNFNSSCRAFKEHSLIEVMPAHSRCFGSCIMPTHFRASLDYCESQCRSEGWATSVVAQGTREKGVPTCTERPPPPSLSSILQRKLR